MQGYLNIVRNVLNNGEWKGNRTGTRTLTTFGEVFRHDMYEGFPLLTTKKMAIKSIAVELEGFIKGIVTKQWYQDRGCHIWDEWANPVTAKQEFDRSEPDGQVPYNEHNRKLSQEMCDDLGPIYGYQWRRFNEAYDENCNGWALNKKLSKECDQLRKIVESLTSNPEDRRMVCSAWNPAQAHMQALPPCHVLWNVCVISDRLNLCWHQRSCDLMLGVPFNIASYGLLLCLLAKHAKLKPGILQGTLVDCHIYENHIDGAKLQLDRIPYKLPEIEITCDNIFDWNHTQFQLHNYKYHPKISFEVAV